MPYTLSHPAAVLPLRRFCPRYLDFSALVIGSVTPDAGYYIRRFDLSSFAHTFLGSFAVCLPVGLVLLFIFYLIRRPVCFIMPVPHRDALFSLASSPVKMNLSRVLILVICLLIGAWTHIFWDSFTHQTGWFVHRVPWLRDPVFTIGATPFYGYYLLQQLSTVAGATLILFAYFTWLHRHRSIRADDTEPERWRYFLWSAIILSSVVVSVPLALRAAASFDGYLALRVLVFRASVYSLSIFVPLIIFASIVAYALRRRT